MPFRIYCERDVFMFGVCEYIKILNNTYIRLLFGYGNAKTITSEELK